MESKIMNNVKKMAEIFLLQTFRNSRIAKSLFLIGSFGFSIHGFNQNCSVNAGIPISFCTGEAVELDGITSGITNTSPVWSQVGGPSIIIDDPSDLTSGITGVSAGNTYTFRLSAVCQDGTAVFDEVIVTIIPLTLPNAGSDIAGCPGTYNLSANTVGTGETGTWSFVGPNQSGVVISDLNDPLSMITFPTTSAGLTILRWTISNGSNGCVGSNTITVFNFGGESSIDAGVDEILPNCYTLTQSTALNASFAGNGTGGQSGVWNLVSGPNYPNFASSGNPTTQVNELIEGVYVFEWTVIGPCVSGSDQVTIIVPAATQDVTIADAPSVIYCTPSSSVLLEGTPPTFANETGLWALVSGPAGSVINSPSSPTTSVTGLDGSSIYTFSYTIENSITNCFSTDNAQIIFRTSAPSIDVGADTVLVCGDSLATISYIALGDGANQYQIISGPITTNSFVGAGSNATTLNLNQSGTYIVRFRRRVIGTDCISAFDDITIIVGLPPSPSNAGTDQVFSCGTTNGTLAANTPPSGIGLWTQVSGPNTALIANIHDPQSTISSLVSGVYEFKWLVSSGPACDAQESIVKVTVSSPLVVVNAGSDQTVCENSPAVTPADAMTPGQTGMWTVVPTGPIFSDPTSSNTTVTGMTAANSPYTFTWTLTNSCGSITDDVIYTVNSTSGASAADAGGDQCLTNGTLTVNLAGVAPTIGSGTWSLISGPTGSSFSNINSETSDLNVVSNGIYKLLWQIDVAGCQSTTDTVLISIGTSAPSDAGADQTICYNGSFSLSANVSTAGIGTWVLVGGPSSIVITDVNDPNSLVTFVDEGVYKFAWNIDDGACTAGSNTDTVRISVGIEPSVSNAGTDQTLCSGSSLLLNGNTPAVGIGSWSIIGSVVNTPSFNDNSSPTATISNLTTGTYTLEWSITNGPYCPASTDQVVLQVSAIADAGVDQNLCEATETNLEGTPGVTGIWTLVSGPPAAIVTTSGFTAIATLAPGNSYTFEFSAPSIFGCPATTDQVVVNTSLYGTVPNAGLDQDLCTTSGTSVTMAANTIALGSGAWSLVSGPNVPTITVVANPGTTVTGLIQGLYIFEWRSINGNCSDFADVIRINVFDPPTVANAGSNQLMACSSNLQLDGNAPLNGIGTWTQISGPVATIDFLIQPNTTISNTSPGTYVFEWTISTTGGVCPASSSQVTITIPSLPPTVPNAGIDFSVCALGTTTMAGNLITDGVGTWVPVSGPNTPVIVSPNLETTTLNGLIDGTYILVWQAVNGGCIENDTIEVIHSSLPSTAIAGSNQTNCPFDLVTLNGNVPTTGIGTWLMVSGPSTPVFVDANDPITSVVGLAVGTYIFEWSINTNSFCTPSTDQVTIIMEPNCAPITFNEFETTAEDVIITTTVANGILSNGDIDNEGQPLTVNTTPVSGPNNGTISINPDGSYVYTPGQDFNGVDTVIVSVCDNGTPPLCTNDTLFFTVTPVNDSPVIDNEILVTDEDTPVGGDLTDTGDSDVDGNLVVNTTPIGGPSNGSIVINPDGTYTYTPNLNFNGLDTVIIEICDDGTPLPIICVNDTIFITVNAINDSPVTDNEILVTDEDTPVGGDLTDTGDSDVDGNLVVNTTPIGGPSNGSIVINPDGTYTYTPNLNFNGLDTVIVEICDDGTPLPVICVNDTIFITVNAINDAPTQGNETLFGVQTGQTTPATSVDLTSNNTDPEGTNINFAGIVSISGGGTVVDNGDGTIDYTPAPGFVGTDTVIYTICDEGLPLPIECINDTLFVVVNACSISDPLDDCDGDGVTNGQEVIDGTSGINPCDFILANVTSIPSAAWLAADCDGDGVTNGQEIVDGTDPLDPCDFVLASATVTPGVAWDTADCDGDGITNEDEVTDGTSPLDPCDFVLANATVTPSTVWDAADCDGDGVTNAQELIDGTDPLDDCAYTITSITLTVTSLSDCDGDGITNSQEAIDGTISTDPCDFVLVSATVTPSAAWDAADCDEDGITNGDEVNDGTNPLDLCDFVLASATVTPGGAWDTSDCDGDGITNEDEVTDGTSPLDPCDFVLANATVTPSAVWDAADCDGDGVTNAQELIDGTDPLDDCDYTITSVTVIVTSLSDCDGDGITNSQEAIDGTIGTDPCDFVLANATVTPSVVWDAADCDGDGVTNGQEIIDGTDPSDDCDYTSPSISLTVTSTGDCDGDGVTNTQEALDGTNGKDPCDLVLANATVSPSAAWDAADCDGDGVTNGQELIDATDPSDDCSYVLSNQTLTPSDLWNSGDCDGDGIPNGEDNDIDGIVVPDGFSPNGDNMNDLFEIIGISGFDKASLIIFNRWGNKVYESTNGYANNWDGTNQFGLSAGERNLPEGTYFFILDLGDGSEVIKDYIYLKR